MIDVWDTGTFDAEIKGRLDAERDLILAYHRRDAEIFRTYDLARGPDRPDFRPSNQHAADFISFVESLISYFEARTIRGFHYTRLADHEVEAIRRDGVHPSTPMSLRKRLEALSENGLLPATDIEAIMASSPFSDPFGRREKMFWMTCAPYPPEYPGVQPLLRHWGGEVAFFRIEGTELGDRLACIGAPRILEVAAPLGVSQHSLGAVEAVVATYARGNGAPAESKLFDFYVEEALPAEAILKIHTVGNAGCIPFTRMARELHARLDVEAGLA
ncbi:hypothetical protein KUV57_12155 [Epibacterium sp. DP7N7-1]|nr:hypothetical protein [Epibacterium sp. DP7N7-1]